MTGDTYCKTCQYWKKTEEGQFLSFINRTSSQLLHLSVWKNDYDFPKFKENIVIKVWNMYTNWIEWDGHVELSTAGAFVRSCFQKGSS